jgi:hypothetical protein
MKLWVSLKEVKEPKEGIGGLLNRRIIHNQLSNTRDFFAQQQKAGRTGQGGGRQVKVWESKKRKEREGCRGEEIGKGGGRERSKLLQYH